MTQSEIRITISKNINEVLKKIYSNISNDKFDLNLDLSEVPSTTLKDFWLYTSGFLGLKNQRDFESTLSDEEIISILNGDFTLRNIPLDQAQKFAQKAKYKNYEKAKKLKIKLYSIQDGTYYLEKGIDENGNPFNQLKLKTDQLTYFSDKAPEEIDISPQEILKTLRNVFAHNIPIVDNKKVIFRRHDSDDEIEVSKMWLRGYTEFFHNKTLTLDSFEIENIINSQQSQNMLNNQQDIDRLLFSLKHLFGEKIDENFTPLSKFFQTKLAGMPNFYSLPREEKVKTISSILANNYNYIVDNTGVVNSTIIYNLQQIVGQSLNKRGEISDLSYDDYDISKMQELAKDINDLSIMYKMVCVMAKSNKQFDKALDRYDKQKNSISSKIKHYLSVLTQKQSLETTNMDLYNPQDLSSLSPEVAFNTMILMCYNCLINSSFYDDLISKTVLDSMSQEQENFFDSFNFDNFGILYNNKFKPISTANNKAFTLLCLREALCHGRITYDFPEPQPGEVINFDDMMVCFKTSDRQSTHIYGSLRDFYNLFSSSKFYEKRPKEIVTGKQNEYSNQYEIKTEEDEQNYRNLNEIVQIIKNYEESLSK